VTYEYQFVTVEPGGRADRDAHRAVVHRWARDGWRLVQIVPLGKARGRHPVELVFERPIAGDGDTPAAPI
jgi:hypothetical protein